MLVGGLVSSLGVSYWARRRGAPLLGKLRWWGVSLFALVSVGAGMGAMYWMVRRALAATAEPGAFASPLELLVFGLGLGLPLSLPGVFTAWNEVRPEKVAERNRRLARATKDDRRAYAEKLLRQIQDASDRPRELTLRVTGDGGRVLLFEGDLKSDEGERLTRALREDLEGLGFKRVERRSPGVPDWWARV